VIQIAIPAKTIELAFRHVERFRYADAISAFDKLIDESPDLNLIAWRAQCLIAAERYEDAITDSFQLLYLDPNNLHACLNLALLYSVSPIDSLRDGKKAKRYMEQFVQGSDIPATWRIYSIQAAVHAQCGDFDSAVHFASLSRDVAPTEMHHRCDERIKQYGQRLPFRCTKHTIQDALALRELRCDTCGKVAFYRTISDNGDRTPICNDCHWGPQ